MKAILLSVPVLAVGVALSVLPRAFYAHAAVPDAPAPLNLSCQPAIAPVAAPFIDKGKNKGVAPPGFVSLGPDIHQEQGVDVSKWQQDVDPFAVKQCGGAFAYIRISAGRLGFNEVSYPSTWGQARAANLYIGAYHYLTFEPESIEFHTIKPSAPEKVLLGEFVKLGHQEADLFMQRYLSLRDDDIKRDPGARFLPPMLAINDTLPLAKPFSTPKKEWLFATLCTFLGDVERNPALHGKRLIIFSDPGTFQQKDYADAPSLRNSPRIYWVQYPTPGAVGLPRKPGDPNFEAINQFCHTSNNVRQCLFHQYTNRGGLPMGSLSEGLDLSRYLGSASLHDLSVGG